MDSQRTDNTHALIDLPVLRLGAIGVDTSHLPEFIRRINTMNDQRKTRCRVTAFHDPGDHQLPATDVAKWRMDTLAMGVTEHATMGGLLDQVDGVLVLAVDGNTHAKLAEPSLKRGLPTYIDKPFACSLKDAQQLYAVASLTGARCYSASSLRFAAEIAALDRAQLGELQVVSAFGPGELNPAMPGLFYYGVHTIEMVDAVWGPGVARVRGTRTDARDLVELQYADGRLAQLRMERKGHYDFGVTVHGTGGVASFRVDFDTIYDRLIAGMVRFFEGEAAPVSLLATLENVAVMEAGNLSIARGGGWVSLRAVR